MSRRYVTRKDPTDLDQYALALILYETITGRRLIKLKEVTELAIANAVRNLSAYPLEIFTTIPPKDRDLAKDLDTFFAVALVQDERQHHTDISSMVSHLGEIWVEHVVPRGEEVVETQRMIVGEVIKRKAKEITFAKWGNSLAVRIPTEIAADLKITEGRNGILTRDKQGIRIVPA